MRPSVHSLIRALTALVLCMGAALRAQVLLPDVQERTLKNGFRVLVAGRPDTGAVHARLFFAAGRANTAGYPAVSADLMARCLFGPRSENAARNGKDLEAALKQEEGAFEALRLEKVKLARQPQVDATGEFQGLEQLHRQALARVQDLVDRSSSGDLFETLRGSGAAVKVEADQIAFGLDLPKESLAAYCRLVSDRLKAPLLARFPLERDRLLRGTDDHSPVARDRKALGVLLGSALAGRPYARACDDGTASLEALAWSDLRAYARWVVSPERAVLVLVGDVKLEEAAPLLDQTFGSLGSGPSPQGSPYDQPLEPPGDGGARRLQVSTPDDFRMLIGWSVPPLTHPDHPALCVLARMLGGGATARLNRKLGGERGLVRNLSVRIGLPGSRETSLLVIEAEPSERHGLPELEQAVQGELLGLQRGIFEEGEIRRAQRQVEADQLMAEEDAAGLAQAMGTAVCQGGDWRLAFRALQSERDFTQQEIQRVALKYLASSRSTTVFLEPDPLLMPQDHLEAQTARILSRLLASKLQDPGKVEAVVRETLRQLRMLPLSERERTLKLFEAQVKP